MGLDEILLLKGLKGVGDKTIVKLLNYLSGEGVAGLLDKPRDHVDKLVISALGSTKRSQSIVEFIFSEDLIEQKNELKKIKAKWAELDVKIVSYSDVD